MPTYDYLCSACSHQFEEFQAITARLLRKCPKCGKRALKRLIGSGGGIIFKGSGFYHTDYKRSSAPKEKSPDAKTPKSSPSKTEKGKNSQGEAKKD